MKTKSWFALALVFALIFHAITPAAYAATNVAAQENAAGVYGDYAVYTSTDEDRITCISIDTTTGLVSFSTINLHDPDYVFEYLFTVDFNEIDTSLPTYWQNLIAYCNAHSSDWKTIYIPNAIVASNNPSRATTPTNEDPEQHFMSTLIEWVGSSAYSGQLVATGYRGNTILHLYEDLALYVTKSQVHYITIGISVASFVASIAIGLSNPVIGALIASVSLLVGGSFIPAGTRLSEYSLEAHWTRYVKRMDSNVWLNSTMLHHKYVGFVSEESGTPFVDEASLTVYCGQTESYFYDAEAQFTDAYAYYLAMQ